MNEQPFILNNRFAIDPSVGSVKDELEKTETRIEPRLMNLLCLLVANNGKLVGRAVITKEIWDDYGNADEGLTQAISYLRKVLADDEKDLIETVPKKGYILHADISDVVKVAGEVYPPKKINSKRVFLIGAVLLLLIAAWFVYKGLQPSPIKNSDMIQQEQKPTHDAGGGDKVKSPDVLPDSSKGGPQGADKKK